jgi:phosphatidylglycerophosphatase A
VTDEPAINPPLRGAAHRPGLRFLVSHPAHLVALGFGSGLSRVAPGTAGTLFAWLIWDLLPLAVLGDIGRAIALVVCTLVGWWASTVTARHLAQADPSAVVCDEIVAFWTILWLVMPAGLVAQAVAFLLFRLFDAVKPGPVAWADQLFKGRRGATPGWAQGFGIMFDDFVAALCTLLVIALWRFVV